MNKKIAITCNDSDKIWSNGLNQNCYFLLKLLNKLGYKAIPVSMSQSSGRSIGEYKIQNLTKDNVKEYSIILEAAFMIDRDIYNIAIDKKIKIISISYGNSLFYLIEGITRNESLDVGVNREGVDIWISPHYDFTTDFNKITSRANVKILPYIWEPWFIDGSISKDFFVNKKYNNNVNKKNISILEPNLSVCKTSIIPLLAVEMFDETYKDKLDKVHVFGSKKLENNIKFIEFLNNLNIYNKRKVFIEPRYSITSLFNSNSIGTILSHQMYNDLNYLTLEALYLGYPIIHNSVACKDAGYYYNEFDIKDAAKGILSAVETEEHQSAIKLDAAKEILWSFSIENPENQKKYLELLRSV